MLRYKILLTLFIGFTCFSQQDSDFMGVIKLNDTSYISYKIAFEIHNDSVSGYSITDMGGKHETKSNLLGSYNEDTREFNFYESNIIYTKSPIIEDDFCFVHFKGRVRDIRDVEEIEGEFTGLYTDGQSCLDGAIKMVSIEKIKKKAEKIDKKIQKIKRVDEEIKKKVSVAKTIDTLSMNIIAQNENLNILTKDPKVEFIIFDAGKEDDDRIDLVINGKKVLENYTVTKEKKIMTIPLEKQQTKIEVIALNVGSSAPNTVKLEFQDSRNFVTTITNLDEGEQASVTLVRR